MCFVEFGDRFTGGSNFAPSFCAKQINIASLYVDFVLVYVSCLNVFVRVNATFAAFSSTQTNYASRLRGISLAFIDRTRDPQSLPITTTQSIKKSDI